MKLKGKNAKLIAFTSRTLFTLATFFAASVAWFTAYRNVKANGNGFEVTKENSILESIEIHTQKENASSPFIFNEESSGSYVFSDTNSNTLVYHGNGNTKIDIGTYSVTDSRKVLLFVYNFKQDQSEDKYHLKLTATSMTNEENSLFYLENGIPKKQLSDKYNDLSSIISFTAFSLDKSSYDLSSQERNFSSFANYSVTNGITYNQSLDLYQRTGKRKSIALILSYNSDNIEYLYSLNLSNPALNNEKVLFDNIDFVLTL